MYRAILAVLLLASATWGQSFEMKRTAGFLEDRNPAELNLSRQPAPFSRRYVFAQLALEGSDAFFTQQAQCRIGWVHCSNNESHEMNPIARPFVVHPQTLALYFVGESVVKIGAAYMAHRRRSRFERWIEFCGLSTSAAGTAISAHTFATDAR